MFARRRGRRATLVFRLRARFVVAADVVLPGRVMATTDEDGAFSVALAVPTPALLASYEFTAPADGSAVFYLESGAPVGWPSPGGAGRERPRRRGGGGGGLTGGGSRRCALITPVAILAMVKDILVAGDNITITEVDGTLILASTGGGTTYAPGSGF